MEEYIDNIKDCLKKYYIDYKDIKLDFIQTKIQEEYKQEQDEEEEDIDMDEEEEKYENFYWIKNNEYFIEYDQQMSSLANKKIYDYFKYTVKNIDDCKYIHEKIREYAEKEYIYFKFLNFYYYEEKLKENEDVSQDYFYILLNYGY